MGLLSVGINQAASMWLLLAPKWAHITPTFPPSPHKVTPPVRLWFISLLRLRSMSSVTSPTVHLWTMIGEDVFSDESVID